MNPCLLRWGVPATVFYDRPRAEMRASTVEELHALLMDLEPVLREPLHPDDCCAALYRESPAPNGAGGLLTDQLEPELHFWASPVLPSLTQARETALLVPIPQLRSVSAWAMAKSR